MVKMFQKILLCGLISAVFFACKEEKDAVPHSFFMKGLPIHLRFARTMKLSPVLYGGQEYVLANPGIQIPALTALNGNTLHVEPSPVEEPAVRVKDKIFRSLQSVQMIRYPFPAKRMVCRTARDEGYLLFDKFFDKVKIFHFFLLYNTKGENRPCFLKKFSGKN